jgi:hypothetical protein
VVSHCSRNITLRVLRGERINAVPSRDGVEQSVVSGTDETETSEKEGRKNCESHV